MHEATGASVGNAAPEAWRSAEYHYPQTTSYEAAAINAGVNIKVFGGIHGHGPAEAHIPGLDVEYAAAKSVVDSLDPNRGDVLFREGMAHDGSYHPWAAQGVTDPVAAEAALDSMRQRRDIDAFTYASELANLRGIPVVYADASQETVAAVSAQVPPDEMAKALEGPYDATWPWHGIMNGVREEQGTATVKDYALEHMPELQARDAAGLEKPTYAVLWAPGHLASSPLQLQGSAGIEAGFANMGLHAEVALLPHANDQRAAYAPVSGPPVTVNVPIPPAPMG